MEEEAIHFMMNRKQMEGIQERTRTRYSPQEYAPVTYFFQPGKKFHHLPVINSEFLIHQLIKPFIRSESSLSNHLWKHPHKHPELYFTNL
jgi:hypothetical protein